MPHAFTPQLLTPLYSIHASECTAGEFEPETQNESPPVEEEEGEAGKPLSRLLPPPPQTADIQRPRQPAEPLTVPIPSLSPQHIKRRVNVIGAAVSYSGVRRNQSSAHSPFSAIITLLGPSSFSSSSTAVVNLIMFGNE